MKLSETRQIAYLALGLFVVWLLVALLDTAALWVRGLPQ
jgi:hypothetical protein